MKLVDDWKYAWKWISMNCMVLAGAIQGAWLFVPDDMRASIPPNIVHKMTLALLAVGIAGRLVKQKGKNDDPDRLG